MMRLNTFELKCIAIVSMVVDHIGYVLYPDMKLFRIFGRIAFPIFCFLVAEGVTHTRNIYRYMLRMAVFALISEVPYDLIFGNGIIDFKSQNVFFTLTLGVCMLHLTGNVTDLWQKIIVLASFMCMNDMLRGDYGMYGILLIFIYGELRKINWFKLTAGALWNFFYPWEIQRYGVLASIPLLLYNGEKGPDIKYFFYLFYPLHLLVLYVIYLFLC